MRISQYMIGNPYEVLEGYTWWGMHRLAKTRDFDKLLLNAIDEALNSLGESVKQSIYFHIENKFCVARNDIPENLEEFQGGLEKIFGDRKSTRLNSSHGYISYAVFCLKKKKKKQLHCYRTYSIALLARD